MIKWSLYEKENDKDKFLKPLMFSNNKSQEDIADEAVEAIKAGNKLIFIHGGCGTGKSAISLNIAKNLGRASIVVPIKNLQKQYEEDYTKKKFLLKDDKEKMKISVITGRQNHPCLFLKESNIQFSGKEKNSSLDIFGPKSREKTELKEDLTANNRFIPCKIELKEKNWDKLEEYIKMNNKVRVENFDNIRKIRRMTIAPVCPYWSPVIPAEVDFKAESEKLSYTGLNNVKYTIHTRTHGCSYYNQYKAYAEADVIIFNSHKYIIESVLNRKPVTDVEIIDECDEFLDSFSNTEKISLKKLGYALRTMFSDEEKYNRIVRELIYETDKIMNDDEIGEYIQDERILKIEKTEVSKLLRKFTETEFMNYVETDEESYAYHVEEIAKEFENFMEETYVAFSKEEDDIIIKIVTINLEKKFKELLDKNKAFVMMSGTLHSEKVLKEVFGLKDFKIIEAEAKMLGTITHMKTGLEINCRYDILRSSRKEYLLALNECVKKAPKPALVHVNSFLDLPNELEKTELKLEVISQIDFEKEQETAEEQVLKFKRKEKNILYSTKCNRGVDFPGDMCKSIILTRYPYPDVNSMFWKILKENRPTIYNDFYMDKSKREFLQRIYRGLRSKDDHIFLLSPDLRVFWSK